MRISITEVVIECDQIRETVEIGIKIILKEEIISSFIINIFILIRVRRSRSRDSRERESRRRDKHRHRTRSRERRDYYEDTRSYHRSRH